MEKSQVEKIIEEAVTGEVLARYMCAEWGEKLGVYADGSVAIGESIGMEINPAERPIAVVKCPGIGNINSLYWTDRWTTYDQEKGLYRTNNGRLLTLKECIQECCEDGEVTIEMEGLQAELVRNWEEFQQETETEKRMTRMYGCENDCSGWQEEYSYTDGEPEGKLKEFLENPTEVCPYCGGEVGWEDFPEEK